MSFEEVTQLSSGFHRQTACTHAHAHAQMSIHGGKRKKANSFHSLLMEGIVQRASGRLNHFIFVGGTPSTLLLQGVAGNLSTHPTGWSPPLNSFRFWSSGGSGSYHCGLRHTFPYSAPGRIFGSVAFLTLVCC